MLQPLWNQVWSHDKWPTSMNTLVKECKHITTYMSLSSGISGSLGGSKKTMTTQMMNFVCVSWWFTKHLSRQAFLLWEIARGIPETPLTTAWWVTSTRLAPPLLQVWPHQEPSIDIQSECQLDVITIPLGVWFFEEANVTYPMLKMVDAFAWIPWKIDFGGFQLSTTEKISRSVRDSKGGNHPITRIFAKTAMWSS